MGTYQGNNTALGAGVSGNHTEGGALLLPAEASRSQPTVMADD
jgi:hypothetical protein